MPAVITGLGTALPKASESTEYFIEHAKSFFCHTPKQERVLAEVYKRTEIKQRASVVDLRATGTAELYSMPVDDVDRGPSTAQRMNRYHQEAAPLAVNACTRALINGNTDASEITHLITVSCTGFHAPGFDIDVIHTLPLRPSTQRTHIGFMGCHGAFNALRVATAFVKADHSAVVLICATELCSLHLHYGWGMNNLLANALFSDGAAALVVRYSTAGPFQHIDSTSHLVADSSEAISWRIGNHGFEMHLSSQVPAIVAANLPKWLASWLQKHDLSVADIAGWAVHPGGPKILDAVAQCLSLPADSLNDSRAILAECGNMSSPTVLFVLERLAARQITGPCVMLGFGPGLTMEAALLNL